tara:strand:+ start:875 stop:1120 length:246 start_codon:yes stop_codon:yes gene_type:complete
MPGIIIYRAYGQYFSFSASDDVVYGGIKQDIISRSEEIVFCRGEISLNQIDDAREGVANIIKMLNSGEEVDAEGKLASYFN